MPRALAFAVFAALILVGPLVGHLTDTGNLSYVGWKMYSRKATDFCAVDYQQVVAGQSQPLDRFAVLKAAPRARDLWRLPNLRAAEQVGQRLCRALGPNADVRVVVRCARPHGWEPVADGSKKLCNGGRR